VKLLLVAAAILVTAAVAAAPARAQSRRYPPEPVDRDEEQAQHSNLWEAAANPQRTPYGKLIFEAEQLLRDGTTAGAQEAVKRLDEAAKLLPDEPKAYHLRGEASLRLKDWPRCAEDLASAWARETASDGGGASRGDGREARSTGRTARGGRGEARTAPPRDPLDPKQATELRRKLGICQARAGRLADAERTLAEAAATGNATGEIWVRLGEVRIAMGKLEEAIAALESAAEQSDAPAALIRWLLAGAYDRARRPAESIEAARKAYELDRTFSTLRNEQLPLLGAGEPEYLQGLAYLAKDQPQPDYALVYFRYFLQVAKDSPWRKRAEEHLRDLKAAELPETIDRRAGNAPLDLTAARAAVRKAMPAMRACAVKTPFIIYEVVIVKAGPRTPPAPLERPRYFTPPESVTIVPTVGLPSTGEVPQADRDGVVRCIDPIASKITFPPIKEKDTHFKLAFSVIAP
jgi:tetratricopeptide (TPR) repeat protein